MAEAVKHEKPKQKVHTIIKPVLPVPSSPKVQHVNFEKCFAPVFSSAEQSITSYYGKDIPKPAKDFLAWFSNKRQELADEFYLQWCDDRIKMPEMLSQGQSAQLVGFWLGAKYMADRNWAFSSLPELVCTKNSSDDNIFGSVKTKDGIALELKLSHEDERLFRDKSSFLIAGLNTGIHEYSHLSPIISHSRPDSANEFETFLVGSRSLLPLKKQDAMACIRASGRYSSQLMKELCDCLVQQKPIDPMQKAMIEHLRIEYMSHLLGPWIYPKLQQLYPESQDLTSRPDLVRKYLDIRIVDYAKEWVDSRSSGAPTTILIEGSEIQIPGLAALVGLFGAYSENKDKEFWDKSKVFFAWLADQFSKGDSEPRPLALLLLFSSSGLEEKDYMRLRTFFSAMYSKLNECFGDPKFPEYLMDRFAMVPKKGIGIG